MRTSKRFLWLFIGLCLTLTFVSKETTEASRLDKRVLFISSYSYSWETVRKQIDGMDRVFDDEITVSYEFMDCKRLDDQVTREFFYKQLKYRLEQEKAYDVIIVGDNTALNFVINHREELFPEIPILFCGISNEKLLQRVKREKGFAGVREEISMQENFELALEIRPNAKKAYAILDNSDIGNVQREKFFAMATTFPELELVEINASELSDAILKLAVKNISSEDILFYISTSSGFNGTQYSSKKIIKLLREHSATPIISMVDIGIGEGVTAGYVSSMENSGIYVARMAKAIMEGSSIDEMELVVDDANGYLVDEQRLNSYGISSKVISKNAQIIHPDISFYERNKQVLVPSILLILSLNLVVVVFWRDRIKTKKILMELEENKIVLKRASQHDFLTGLSNRSKFMNDINELIQDGRACSVIMLDIDNFKSINDTYGHSVGDEALIQVSSRLKEMQSPILKAYRYAGDEFILILQSNQDMMMKKTAHACRQVFSKSFKVNGQYMDIGGSMGIASFPGDAEDVETLVTCADNAMYAVKKNGKNDFAFYQRSIFES